MNWLSKYNKHILPVYIFEVCLVASNSQFIGIILFQHIICNDRYHNLINFYGISVSQMTRDMFLLSK